MSDLLKRLENRRKQRIGIKAIIIDCPPGTVQVGMDCVVPEEECQPPAEGCPAGYIWDPARCECVIPDCGEGNIWDMDLLECIPDPDYVCPPEDCPTGYVWDQERCECVPIPVIPIPEPTPESPVILESVPVGNIGNALGIFTGKVSALNILRLRVHMGNEHGLLKGWHTVTFPKEMEQAHVLAASGPRSAAVPVFEVRMARRADYSLKFAQNVANIILDPIKEIIPNIWPLHEVINDILKPMVGGLSRVIGEITYDIVVKPTLEVSQEIVNEALPRLPEAWGMDRERSVTTVDIRNITTTNFEWYSYGDMYINWIAIGFLLADEETPLPPEIAEPLEEFKKLQTRFDELQSKFEELKLKIGIEPTEPLIPPILPLKEPVIEGGGDRIFSMKNIQKRRKERLERG